MERMILELAFEDWVDMEKENSNLGEDHEQKLGYTSSENIETSPEACNIVYMHGRRRKPVRQQTENGNWMLSKNKWKKEWRDEGMKAEREERKEGEKERRERRKEERNSSVQ